MKRDRKKERERKAEGKNGILNLTSNDDHYFFFLLLLLENLVDTFMPLQEIYLKILHRTPFKIPLLHNLMNT